MDRKTSAPSETPLRTLADDELSEVTGACHGHHRRHRRRHDEDLQQAGGQDQGLLALLSLLQQSNTAAIFQIVIGNSAPVNLSALVAQASVAGDV